MTQRHLFLTGVPGVGKSTLCQRVVHEVAAKGWECSGFYTCEVRDASGDRYGFDVVTLDGKRGTLARVGKGRGPAVGKYTVDVNSFESVALPALRVSPNSSMALVLVDEIGKMELFSRVFFPAVRALLDNPRVVVFGTVPVPKERPLREVEEVSSRPDVEMITVTRANRDQLVSITTDKLQRRLQGAGP